MQHTFNSHVSSGTHMCINKAIHMLLMQGFGTLITFVPGHYICSWPLHLFLATTFYDSWSLFYMAWPWNMNIDENIQPPVDWETAKNMMPYFS